jgi:hypothetical protein
MRVPTDETEALTGVSNLRVRGLTGVPTRETEA